jgi:predicted aspartyl protease
MLRGRFGDTSHRPYLEGRVYFPRLKLQSDISFLVDTGADRTIIMPDDAKRSGVDFNQLTGNEDIGGASGHMNTFVEHAIVVFADTKVALYAYRLDVLIAPAGQDLSRTPSLLGRDILDRWRMIYYPKAGRLLFTVIDADVTIPV